MFTIKAVSFWEKLFTPPKKTAKKVTHTPRYFIIPGLVADPFYLYTRAYIYTHHSSTERERDRETERLPLLFFFFFFFFRR